MQLKYFVITTAQVFAVVAAGVEAQRVFTGKRVFHTIIDKSPFMVERTSTFTWTQSTSITTTEPTSAPTPTIEY